MKIRKVLFIVLLLLGAIILRAQNNFQITYSAIGNEVIEWLIPSNDGNLILAGNTNSFDPDGDGLIIKSGLDGNIIWSKIIGGPGLDALTRIISCRDGGYVAVGYTESYGQGDWDAWITRINEDGEVIWSACLGTPDRDGARAITQTKDGGFMVVGQDENFYGSFILALNSQGQFLWKKEYEVGIVFWYNDVYETGDGGFYLTGCLNHDGFGIHDTFIMETNPTGGIVRCKYFGGIDNDSFRILFPCQDGFLAVGDTWSWANHQLGWLAKINPDLTVDNSIVLGDTNVNQVLESACFISNSIYVTIKLANSKAYIIELDSLLNLKQSWQFNPGYSSYSSHIISAEDKSLFFSGSSTKDQTSTKDTYLARFHPDDSTYVCNTFPHSTFIMNVNVPSSNLNIYEYSNQPVFQHLDIVSSDISFQSERYCPVFPSADFSCPDLACVNEAVSIINYSQYGLSYDWTFEGAVPATSDSIDPGTIYYENPGIYNIKLVVSNVDGIDSLVRPIIIYPDVGFSLGPDTTILLTSTLDFVLIGGYDSYLWSTGDTTSYLVIPASELQIGNNLIWLEITNGPCVASDSIYITVVDDSYIKENELSDILLYPNPASGSVQITGKSTEVPATVVFYNHLGVKVMSFHPLNNSLDIKGLKPGVYNTELIFREYTVKRRLIII